MDEHVDLISGENAPSSILWLYLRYCVCAVHADLQKKNIINTVQQVSGIFRLPQILSSPLEKNEIR